MESGTLTTEALITVRMEELVDRRTPWHRSLWQVGTLLALREVVEYADGVRSGVMRPEGIEYVCASALRAVCRDRGIADSPAKVRVTEVLELGSKKEGVTKREVSDSLAQYVRRFERDYLRSWATALTAGEVVATDGELTARAVVGHLLDAGFSADHLHGWLLKSRDAETSLVELLEKADEMFGRPTVNYNVLVPFSRLPPEVARDAGERFLTWPMMAEWLRTEGYPKVPASIREGTGALIFAVAAREPKAAIEAAEADLRRLRARVGVGLFSKDAVPADMALVYPASRPKWLPLRPWQKDFLVSSIVRHDLLVPAVASVGASALDDAFELLAAVQMTPSGASVATLWAAVEGLLARGNETGVIAADRLAAIVAGGFVRAELTQLAERLATDEGEHGDLMRSLESTRRLDALVDLIVEDGNIKWEAADIAAISRVRQIVDAPAEVMGRMRGYFCDAFRRLYTQRNLLLHGGRFNSVVLSATMRTVPPLVAAGIDRLVHGEMQKPRTDPFSLAARAENELGMLGAPGARAFHRLLD
ncbi:hypothetical protein [Ornithinimicrobium sp. Y1694]|uniref:hypothetical protein n=1 Tax=Ornithinimicrobium sp. Y1694 TaxID=3418590 RepID=UPI003CF8B009